MKKVLLVSNKVFHYRVSIYNYFSARFQKYGWEFIVRADSLERRNPFPLEFDFAEIPFNFFRYKDEIEKIDPDVIITFLHLKDKITWPLMHWLKYSRRPFVYWNKGVNLEVRNPRLRNLFFYYIHWLCNAIILYSKHEVKYILPSQRYKIFIANNTLNFDSFPKILQSKEDIKKEFGIPFDKVVLFVGRMRPVKKDEHLIQVFDELSDSRVGCVLVGNAMGYDIPRMIKKKNILYLGEIHDPENLQISKLFKVSDIFCIPGDVGLGLNQAFYWGLPVVTEAGLQPPEIHYLHNGRNGFIVPENDIAELKKKITLLLDNDELRDRFSRNAREDILKEAPIERMFQGFLDCLTFLTSGKRPRIERA